MEKKPWERTRGFSALLGMSVVAFLALAGAVLFTWLVVLAVYTALFSPSEPVDTRYVLATMGFTSLVILCLFVYGVSKPKSFLRDKGPEPMGPPPESSVAGAHFRVHFEPTISVRLMRGEGTVSFRADRLEVSGEVSWPVWVYGAILVGVTICTLILVPFRLLLVSFPSVPLIVYAASWRQLSFRVPYGPGRRARTLCCWARLRTPRQRVSALQFTVARPDAERLYREIANHFARN